MATTTSKNKATTSKTRKNQKSICGSPEIKELKRTIERFKMKAMLKDFEGYLDDDIRTIIFDKLTKADLECTFGLVKKRTLLLLAMKKYQAIFSENLKKLMGEYIIIPLLLRVYTFRQITKYTDSSKYHYKIIDDVMPFIVEGALGCITEAILKIKKPEFIEENDVPAEEVYDIIVNFINDLLTKNFYSYALSIANEDPSSRKTIDKIKVKCGELKKMLFTQETIENHPNVLSIDDIRNMTYSDDNSDDE